MELQPRFDQARAGRVVVPKGHVWVEGDNATMSVDSRHIGAVPAALISGRVQAVVSSSSLSSWFWWILRRHFALLFCFRRGRPSTCRL